MSAESDFGIRVRQRRYELGLTQRDLAERMRLDPSAISRIEDGSRAVPVGEVVQLVAALDTDLSVLFDRPPVVVADDGVTICVTEDGVERAVSVGRSDVAAIVHQLVAWLAAER